MNWRYFYIGSVVALSYVLFLSWNAEQEIKQEFAEASANSCFISFSEFHDKNKT